MTKRDYQKQSQKLSNRTPDITLDDKQKHRCKSKKKEKRNTFKIKNKNVDYIFLFNWRKEKNVS